MKVLITESQLKDIIKDHKPNLNEDGRSFSNLNSDEQEKLFDLFKKSYEKSIGTSWTKDKFFGRARNWTFFGDDRGFVAVRQQNSGYYKLVGVGGELRGILSGLDELLSLNVPVWGMVSSDIQKMVLKKGFKTPPVFLLKVLLKFIPKSVFGGVDYEINSDGSLTLKYEDVGDARKYFIGNDAYFKELRKSVLPQIKDKVPAMVSKGIKMFLGENETQLDEEITSGSIIVYHRTGRSGSPIEGIASDGFRVGGGSSYGVGVYTTYTLESQLKPNMRNTYGNIIIESRVLSMDRFLIFDYDIAKKIYGSNFTLDKQLQRILGKEWNNYKNDTNLKPLIEKIPVVKYTSEIANPFVSRYGNIVSKLRGIVFTGSNDGNVLVSYDRKNVEPLRYTLNEGETWVNILNKNIYKRQKGYNTEESDTELEHVINNLQVGRGLNGTEINFFLKNNNNPKIKEVINKLDSDGIRDLLRIQKPDRVINTLLSTEGFIDRLDSDVIRELLWNSNEPDKIIEKLLSTEGFINKLDSDGIQIILRNSKEPYEVINTLLSTKGFIDKLYSDGIYNILDSSNEPDKIIERLLSTKGFIDRLYSDGIYNILRNSNEPDKVINMLGDKGVEYVNKLDSDGIGSLLEYSNEPDKIIEKLLSTKGFIDRLDSDGIGSLLEYSNEPDKIINILLSTEGFIDKLGQYGIGGLLRNSNEPERIINILGDKGVEYVNNLKLNPNRIYNLLDSSKEPEKIIKMLGDDGVEYVNNLHSTYIESLLSTSNYPEKTREMFRKYRPDIPLNESIDKIIKSVLMEEFNKSKDIY